MEIMALVISLVALGLSLYNLSLSLIKRKWSTWKNYWKTTLQVEEEYEIKADTLRSYLNRKQVIPEGKDIKVGKQWFISRDWLDEKYKKGSKQVQPRYIRRTRRDCKPGTRRNCLHYYRKTGSGLIKFTYLTLFCFPGEFRQAWPPSWRFIWLLIATFI